MGISDFFKQSWHKFKSDYAAEMKKAEEKRKIAMDKLAERKSSMQKKAEETQRKIAEVHIKKTPQKQKATSVPMPVKIAIPAGSAEEMKETNSEKAQIAIENWINGQAYRSYKDKYKNMTASKESFEHEKIAAPWTSHIIVTIERNISDENRTISVRKAELNNYRDLFLTGFCFLRNAERSFKLDSADGENVIYNGNTYEPWQFFREFKKILQEINEHCHEEKE